jgi:hypothetical protein
MPTACPQWASSKGRVLTAVFKRTEPTKGNGASRSSIRVVHLQDDAASGRVIKTTVASGHGVRTGHEDDGSVTTQRQDE